MKTWTTFAAVLAAVAAMITWALSDDRLSDVEQSAMAARAFAQSLPQQGCVTAQDIVAQAQARGWAHGTREDFDYCVAPSGLRNWHWVEVQPALLMSTDEENRLYFGFDAQGCSLSWDYVACN